MTPPAAPRETVEINASTYDSLTTAKSRSHAPTTMSTDMKKPASQSWPCRRRYMEIHIAGSVAAKPP